MSLCVSVSRLPRSLTNSPLKVGDDILEINGVPIVDQNQSEVRVCVCVCACVRACMHACVYCECCSLTREVAGQFVLPHMAVCGCILVYIMYLLYVHMPESYTNYPL